MMLIRGILLVSILVGVEASPLGKAVKIVDGRDIAVTQTQFDNFRYFAQYAAAAYCENNDNTTPGPISCINDVCPEVVVANAVSILGFNNDTSSSPDLIGYLALDPTRSLLLIVFRGTYSIRNWIANLELDLIAAPDFCAGCAVHSGFHAAWLERSALITAAVLAALATNPSYRLIITGHSLGGAVATLAGAHFRSVAGVPCDIYTYGSPRVGNAAFAAYISDTDADMGSISRVTHANDPVPHLPPGGPLTGYYHSSPEYWLDDGGVTTTTTRAYGPPDVVVCQGIEVDDTCGAGSVAPWECNVLAHAYYFVEIISCEPVFEYR